MTKAKSKAKRGRKKGNGKRKGRTAPGPLTPTGGNHREATGTARRAERQRRAWRMFVYQRMSMREIAEALTADGLDCTPKTIALDIHEMFAEVKAERASTRSAAPEVEEIRIDELDRALRPLAMGELSDVRMEGRGRKKKAVRIPLRAEASARIRMEAIGQLRRNGESRRKLLGIDQQPDAGYVETARVAEIIRLLVGDIILITLATPEVRAALVAAFKKRFGVLDVVDVTPTRETGT